MKTVNFVSETPNEYDKKIEDTIPFYLEISRQTIDLVKTFGKEKAVWLDTGCGTGNLVCKAFRLFPDYSFICCDPSSEMISLAIKKFETENVKAEIREISSEQLDYKSEIDIITAIQSHHYLQEDERKIAVQKCYDSLKSGGVFIAFENFAPSSKFTKEIVLNRWECYQKGHGKSEEEVKKHISRYGKNYFPITVFEHLKLLKDCGFKEAEVFWLSYMQVGIYAVK